MVGREQQIDVGPMSGRSNVIYWLEHHGVAPTDQVVERIFLTAKQSSHVLSDAEILALISD
jgi:2-isopropylmalate synthase